MLRIRESLGIAALTCSAYAAVAAEPSTIHACYVKQSGAVRIIGAAAKCRSGEAAIWWNAAGPAGPRGAEGPQGLPGSAGPMGPTGSTGPAGPAGSNGQPGPQGVQGLAGPAGANGANGIGFNFRSAWLSAVNYSANDVVVEGGQTYVALAGSAGVDPALDAISIGGHWAVMAASGAQGPAGQQGSDGATGAQGIPGPQGPPGANGAQGPAGPAGANGSSGAQGPSGDPGPAGANGLGFNFRSQWNPSTPYSLNDVVTQGGQSYVALANNTGVSPANDAANSGGNWALMAAAGTTNFLGSNTLKFAAGSAAGADCTLGSVTLSIAGQYATNYLPADGRSLQIATYPSLYALVGTNYGGDGVNTFALPDLREAIPNNTQYLVCVAGESANP